MPWSLLAATLVASVALTARLLVWLPPPQLIRILPWLQSLAAGLLMGDALLHMVPDALAQGESIGRVGPHILMGMLALFTVECVLRALRTPGTTATFAHMNIVGDALHHLVDGVVIGASFTVNPAVGWLVALAIMLHELPREVSNAGVLIAGGYDRDAAFILTFATCGATPFGALLMAGLAPAAFLAESLVLAAGTTLYLACGDLIPALWANATKSRQRLAPALGVSAGVILMWIAALLERAVLK
ncbi:ZIP family metal transporter [Dyella psychrodurans]|nr:ZIP family metal transporter [Dyella psychrodurans]